MSDHVSSTSGTSDDSPVPNLTQNDLRSVMRSNNRVLRDAVGRVIDELESENRHYAAFGNAP